MIMPFDLTPWKPFREMTTLRDEMDKLWNRFFEGWQGMEPLRGEWAPSLDVSETKNNMVVKAELPGMDPKDVDISYANGLLTIRGDKKQEKEEKDENYHSIERSYGSFSRSIRVPHEVESEKIKADYKNGVLRITLPKSEEAKKKQIKIKVE
jgi:HSP20 family protein